MCLKNSMNLSTAFLSKYFVTYWLVLQVSGNTTISERYQRSIFLSLQLVYFVCSKCWWHLCQCDYKEEIEKNNSNLKLLFRYPVSWLRRILLCSLLWWVILFWRITMCFLQEGDQFIQYFCDLSFPIFSSPSSPSWSHLFIVTQLLHDLKICNLWPCSLYSLCQKLYLFSGKTWQDSCYMDHTVLQPTYNGSKLYFSLLLLLSCYEHVWAFLWESHMDSGNTFPSLSGLVGKTSESTAAKYCGWCLLISLEEGWMDGCKACASFFFPIIPPPASFLDRCFVNLPLLKVSDFSSPIYFRNYFLTLSFPLQQMNWQLLDFLFSHYSCQTEFLPKIPP